MYLFYTPDIASVHTLDEQESAHCVRVLRHTRGDEIHLTDGRGQMYVARITNPHPKHCEFEVLSCERQVKTHRCHIHLAIAPTKNMERIEWAIEKCTEIGVDEITPLLCRFSERKQLRLDRLEKIILSAAKQSLTAYIPQLHPLTSFDDLLASLQDAHQPAAPLCYIAHCYKQDKRQLADELQRVLSDATYRASLQADEPHILLLIGPEGDFSPEEVDSALARGFIPVALGDSRLRTETAGIVACHTAVLLTSLYHNS